MTDLAKLSAKRLHEVIASRDAIWTKMLNETIAAGMGQLRHSEIEQLAKGSSLLTKTRIARDYLSARQEWREALGELDARKAYHGSDKPIRRGKK